MLTLNEEMIKHLPKDRLIKAVVVTKTASAVLEFTPSVSFTVPLSDIDLEFNSGDRLKVDDNNVISEVVKTATSVSNKSSSGRSPIMESDRSW